MKPAIFAVFVFSCCLTGMVMAQGAAPNMDRKVDPRVTQLEMALNHVSQEQQSVYQQFQMLQELRRNETQDANMLVTQDMGGVKDMPPISYDDSIRLQRERKERFQQQSRDLDRLYARYAE
jgi:hypothetical protein